MGSGKTEMYFVVNLFVAEKCVVHSDLFDVFLLLYWVLLQKI